VSVLSAATVESNLMGKVSRSTKILDTPIKIFSPPAILIIRNGYAGKMIYIDSSDFTTTDHAYVMTVKKEWKNKVNLRWFAFQYQELFKNLVTSKSDNATFNKLYAEKKLVNLPDIKIQNQLAEKIEEFESLQKKLSSLKSEISKIIKSEIT